MDVGKLHICSCRTSGCYVCSSRFSKRKMNMDVEKLHICSCRTSGCYVCSSRFSEWKMNMDVEKLHICSCKHLDVMYVVQGSPNGR